MPFFDADPVARCAKADDPQMTAVLRITKTTRKLWLFLNVVAQERYFGGSIVGQKFSVQIGVAQDEGRLAIRSDPEGAFEAVKFLNAGGVSFSINRWDALPKSPRPKTAVKFVSSKGGIILLQLPSWACPDVAGGKLAKPGLTSFAAAGKRKTLGR